MNKKQVISSLCNIANELDLGGFFHEASQMTHLMTKIAQFNDGRDKTKFHSLRDVTTRPSRNISTEIKNTGISPKVLDMAKLIKKENAYLTAKWIRSSFNQMENDFLDKVINKTVDPDTFDYNNISNYNYKSPTQKMNDELLKNKVKNSYENENYFQSSASRYFLEQINLYFKTCKITRHNPAMRGTMGLDPSSINEYRRLLAEIDVNDNLSTNEKDFLVNILKKGTSQMLRGLRPQQVYVPFEKIEH